MYSSHDRYLFFSLDQAVHDVDEEIKVKCPCGNDEVLLISHVTSIREDKMAFTSDHASILMLYIYGIFIQVFQR